MSVSTLDQNASKGKEPRQTNKAINPYALHLIQCPTRPAMSLASHLRTHTRREEHAVLAPEPSKQRRATLARSHAHRSTAPRSPLHLVCKSGSSRTGAVSPLYSRRTQPITKLIERARLIGALAAQSGIDAGKGWTSDA